MLGGPRHQINVPRDTNQVRNFRKEASRQIRLSHDAIFNTYQLCFQLTLNNKKGEPISFLQYFSVHPTILLHLIAQPLADALDVLLRASSKPVILHYDTVFNMGDFYLSTLVFRHNMFQKSPVIPIAFIIHSCQFQEDHLKFLAAIRKRVNLLSSKRIVVVSDREFDFSDIFIGNSCILLEPFGTGPYTLS